MKEEYEFNLKEILDLSNILPIPLQYLFLRNLNLCIEKFKKGEKNG